MKRKIIFIILIAIFLYSAYQLFLIFNEYRKGEKEYEQIRDEIITELEEAEQEKEGAAAGKPADSPRVRVDFGKLLEMNEDTVAWIRFDKPEEIDYPVVQTSDNYTYLTRTFSGVTNSSGTLFVERTNAKDFSDKNTFIYGHNMKNGAMFGELKKYKDEKFYKENPNFYIYTPDGKVRTYTIFAVSYAESDSEIYDIWYNSDEEFLSYIDMVRAGAIYPTDVPVEADDLILSLSTCTNTAESSRMLVQAVLTDKQEGR